MKYMLYKKVEILTKKHSSPLQVSIQTEKSPSFANNRQKDCYSGYNIKGRESYSTPSHLINHFSPVITRLRENTYIWGEVCNLAAAAAAGRYIQVCSGSDVSRFHLLDPPISADGGFMASYAIKRLAGLGQENITQNGELGEGGVN